MEKEVAISPLVVPSSQVWKYLAVQSEFQVRSRGSVQWEVPLQRTSRVVTP